MSGIINCQVCTEKINKSTRSLVQCKCEYTCCKSCAKMYLLSCSKNPHCMNCKVEWNREFMVINFDKNFINKPMKNHRENVLYEREIALLPMTQPFVEHRKKVNEKEKRVVFLRQELVLIYEIIKTAQDTQNTTEEYYKNYVNQTFAYEREIYDLQIEIFQLKDNGIDEKVVKEFIRQCPNNTCKGFLSKNLHCELCQIQACADCHEIKSTDHVCNPDTIETIKSMKNNTKPCPKCATLIFKIEGCFKADTPILMWDQTIKMSQNIKIGDILIGDDGEKRVVLDTCQGEDDMYEVIQNNGEKYIVNSKHKLVLKGVGVGEPIEMLVSDYMKLSDKQKKYLYGYKSSNGINYEEQYVELDPYMLGLWLGDGTHSHPIIASNDYEIQKYLLKWCEKNNAELVHDEGVKFRIRRKGQNNGKDKLKKSVGNNSECGGCRIKKQKICEIKNEENIKIINNRGKNPFMEMLHKYNLVNNKHIPNDYMMNSRDIRLKLLAGLIDSDGCVLNNGKRISIGQVNKKLSNQIELLCRSLGYVVNTRIVKRNNVKCPGVDKKDYQDSHQINISGKISEIPTLLYRKKCNDSMPNKDYQKTSIHVKHIGVDKYYGWKVNGNKRFIGIDFTVLRNCDQMYCIQCHTAFSWKTLQIETGTIHNPHYFEWMRQQNNGQVPRNPLDIPCGREINARFASSLYNILDKLGVTHLYTTPIYDICLRITHIREVDKLKYYINPQNTNLDLRIEYMMNNMDQQKFKMELQRREKKNEKKTEIYNIIDMFVNCITDIFYNFDNQLRNDYKKYLDMIKKLIEDGDFSLDFKKKIQKAEYFQKVWRILEKNIKKENTELIIVLQTQLINIKNKFNVKLYEYCIELLSEIEYLRKYVNEQLEKLATIYNCKKLSFNNHFCLV